jgi:regulator of ribonuclease activity A
MSLKTSDLCDACEARRALRVALRGWGRRRAFAGNIRTVRCHEDIALMRDMVNQPGQGQVLVIDGGGSLARAIFGDVMAAVASRNGWAGLVINGAIRDGLEIDQHGHRREGAGHGAQARRAHRAPARSTCR